jgi:hypothetical protein
MVCAEYSHGKAVVVGRLTQITAIPRGAPDYFVYKMDLVRELRGSVTPTFEIYEGNNSGRATFDWKRGTSYLLFLEVDDKNRWAIDGCGNSAPLSKAGTALKQIQDGIDGKLPSTISGTVSTGSWTTGVPGVDVKISGTNGFWKIKTDAQGRFSAVVPPGDYEATASMDGRLIPAEPFGYENPQRLTIKRGGCAQVQFTDPR